MSTRSDARSRLFIGKCVYWCAWTRMYGCWRLLSKVFTLSISLQSEPGAQWLARLEWWLSNAKVSAPSSSRLTGISPTVIWVLEMRPSLFRGKHFTSRGNSSASKPWLQPQCVSLFWCPREAASQHACPLDRVQNYTRLAGGTRERNLCYPIHCIPYKMPLSELKRWCAWA